MQKYNTFVPRLAALILDLILLSPLVIIDEYAKESSLTLNAKHAINVLLDSTGTFYVILMHYFFGQTVGKMLMKVKVLDITEKPITFVQSILRDSPQLAVLVVFLVFGNPEYLIKGEFSTTDFLANPVGSSALFLLMAWGLADILVFLKSEKRRALHDIIAGTVVVRIEENESQDG